MCVIRSTRRRDHFAPRPITCTNVETQQTRAQTRFVEMVQYTRYFNREIPREKPLSIFLHYNNTILVTSVILGFLSENENKRVWRIIAIAMVEKKKEKTFDWMAIARVQESNTTTRVHHLLGNNNNNCNTIENVDCRRKCKRIRVRSDIFW